MVQTISLTNINAYNEFYRLYEKSDTKMNFENWCYLQGYTDVLYKSIENYIETGDQYNGDNNVDTLSRKRTITSGDFSLCQTQDEDTYFEINWASGTLSVKNKNEVAEILGLDTNAQYDTITFKNGEALITDYTSDNLDDGQDKTTKSLRSSKYGNVATFVTQEFDIDYVLNAIYMDPSDPQYAIAKQILDDLFTNAHAWLTNEEIAELSRLKSTYGDTSAEYNDYLKDLIVNKLFDGKWDPNHNHVHKTGSEFDAGEDGDQNGSVPAYNKYEVIKASGYRSQYDANACITGPWRSEDNGGEDRVVDAQQIMEPIINNLIMALQSQLGDKWTSEMSKYCETIKDDLLNGLLETADEGICDNQKIKGTKYWAVTDQKTRWFSDKRCVVISVKNLADEFFKRFDEMCKYNGKTQDEINAAEAEAAESYKNQKAAYQSLSTMSMSSVASEAGVKSSYQVVKPQSTYDIMDKAEESILAPVKAQLKKKFAGKIPDKDLDAILNYAIDKALENPEDWATQYSDYSYVINSSKVIQSFENAVREAVKKIEAKANRR